MQFRFYPFVKAGSPKVLFPPKTNNGRDDGHDDVDKDLNRCHLSLKKKPLSVPDPITLNRHISQFGTRWRTRKIIFRTRKIHTYLTMTWTGRGPCAKSCISTMRHGHLQTCRFSCHSNLPESTNHNTRQLILRRCPAIPGRRVGGRNAQVLSREL